MENFIQNPKNYVSRIIESGDKAVIDVVMIYPFGKPIVPEFTDPDAPEITHKLNMFWYVIDKDTGHSTEYLEGSGITIIDNSSGWVRLTIPAGVLKSQKGFQHKLFGYYDDDVEKNRLIARGNIDVITPGVDMLT